MTTLSDTQHAADLVRVVTQDRDRAIRKAHAAGHPLREIATAASMSVEGVRKIINRA